MRPPDNDDITLEDLLNLVLPDEDELKRGVQRARARPDTEWQWAPRDWPQQWDSAIGGMRPCGRSMRWRGNVCFVVSEIWPHGLDRPAGWIASNRRLIYSRNEQWVFATEAEARQVADDIVVISWVSI
jgi:hypothetical protein